MPYLRLFHGRSDPQQSLDDWGDDGPIFGPYDFVHTTYADRIKLGNEDDHLLRIVEGLVYYGGMYYGDWSVFGESGHSLVRGSLTAFDPQQAIPPHHTSCCDCELPGR